MTDKQPKTILQKTFDPPLDLRDGYELLVTQSGPLGAVDHVQVDLIQVEKDDGERADDAIDRIAQHVVQSAVAVLQVSAVAWARVAGTLQWVARKVGASV